MFSAQKADKLQKLFKEKRYNRLHKRLLRTFDEFNKKVYAGFSKHTLQEIDRFIDVFFYLLSKKEFILGHYHRRYLQYVTLLENLTFLSSYTSTTSLLKTLCRHSDSEIYKILLLLNMRIKIDFELVDDLFKQDSVLGSYWLYCVYARHCFFNTLVADNLKILQQRLINYNLHPFKNICSVYFNATYVNPANHLEVRKKINDTIKEKIVFTQVENVSEHNLKPKIAILSKNWVRDSAVRKCIGAFIKNLKDDYVLSLIQINGSGSLKTPQYFTNMYNITTNGMHIDYSSIVKNDFNIIIFPDIGLNTESLLLSNLRMAPVQISMYGHPVSSASKEIDFFFVGNLSETEQVRQHYTEKVVPIKGPGMNSMRPPVDRPSFREKSACLADKKIHIFVSSSAPKINSLIKHYWKRIVDEAQEKIKLHFLPGNAAMQEISVLRYEMEDLIGRTNVTIHRYKHYGQYMNVIKKCDLAIGSYHYGDFNRVIDALWMGTPFIAVQGVCGYQNTGAAALRAVELDELIVSDLDEYVSKTIELITDSQRRKQLQHKILRYNLVDRLINNKCYIQDFKEKINNLIDLSVLPKAV